MRLGDMHLESWRFEEAKGQRRAGLQVWRLVGHLDTWSFGDWDWERRFKGWKFGGLEISNVCFEAWRLPKFGSSDISWKFGVLANRKMFGSLDGWRITKFGIWRFRDSQRLEAQSVVTIESI